MIVLIVFTVFFHLMINDSYGPLLHSLPLTLADYIGEEHAVASDTPSAPEEPHDAVPGDKKASNAADLEAQHDAAAGQSTDNGEDEASSDDEPDMKPREQTDYGFAHPATSRPQRTVWMAKDTLGLSAEEMAAIRERGIDVSCEDAEMDAKGDVTITGPPPGEDPDA